MGLSIFVSGGNKESKMVHGTLWIFPFTQHLKKRVIPVISNRNIDHISNMIWCWMFFRKTNLFFPNGLDVSDFIYYGCIFFNIGSDNVLVSASCDDMYLVAFSC